MIKQSVNNQEEEEHPFAKDEKMGEAKGGRGRLMNLGG